MKLLEVVELFNSKQKRKAELVKMLGCTDDFLTKTLRENGFIFSQTNKIYEFTSEGDPVDIDLEPLIPKKQDKKNNNVNKSNNNQKKIRKESDNIKVSSEQNSELFLTEREIKFVKDLVKGRDEWSKEFEMNYDFSKLPARKPTKKTSYEISMATYERFEEFAATTGDRHRMSKNDLVEIALLRLIRDFS